MEFLSWAEPEQGGGLSIGEGPPTLSVAVLKPQSVRTLAGPHTLAPLGEKADALVSPPPEDLESSPPASRVGCLLGPPEIGDFPSHQPCQEEIHSEDRRPTGSWHQDVGCDAESRSAGAWPGSAGLSGAQGRQAGKADSWPHGATTLPPPHRPASSSHSDSYLHQEPSSAPWLAECQRRASLGRAGQEKRARRKMRVYSSNSPSEESFSSPSLDGITLLPGAPFPRDCPQSLGKPAPRETERLGLQPAPERLPPPPPPPCEVPESLDPALAPGSRGPVTQESRRRFSASEMMNKLQLSQRCRTTFSLKLGKSFPARERGSQPAGQDKPARKERSLSGGASNWAHDPTSAASARDERSSRNDSAAEEEEEEEGTIHQDALPLQEKRCSRFLLNSILYQEYSAAATNREIQRQQREDALGEEEEGPSGALLPPKGNLSPSSSFRSQRASGGSSFSLWQDIPNVRSSGFLGTISMQACKLQEAKFELITSEASYIHSLSIAIEHFMNSRELNESLSAREKQWLFSKLPEAKGVSERFLRDLEERLEEDVLRFDVCDIVLCHCPAFRRIYLPYVTNQAYQEQTYQRLLMENPKFPGILAKLEEGPVCQRLPLTSFLILPFQRVTRLKMLVENILKRTLQGSRDEETATKAFNELKKLVKECNTSVQSMKRTEELIHLSKKIHFESKIFPLISQSRWLVKHGELVEVDIHVSSASSSSKLKLSAKMVYLHLFNDCLLLSRKKETGKFAVFIHAKLHELRVTDLSSKLHGIPGQIFLLQLLSNQPLTHQILLRTQSESEKQRWISALVPTSPQLDNELISENDDMAQVQCIKAYKAQEHDELNLEKADILGVWMKTSDGWMEGIRLSDREQGWLPATHVEEIASRRARLRNLRENSRIHHATRTLEGEPT
ncbi:rho guanine nucleotide exchange factor 19 [Elgaria multicarinata webbii]|uniref:rho guanine nucleotide exchange factor 19 n=1 Tax=Elgaria multicarinata webbii TaxID=159646 RepID=UPI002FCD448E